MKMARRERIQATVAVLTELSGKQGYLTAEDISSAVDEAEVSDNEALSEIYETLLEAGLDVKVAPEESDDEAAASARLSQVLRPVAADFSSVEIDDSISMYLKEIGDIPLLTGEEERTLAMAQEAGLEAREKLAGPDAATLSPAERDNLQRQVRQGELARLQITRANSRLVVHVAKKYINHGVPFLDLIQEGNLGLMRAVQKFDYRKGFKFSTYATWWIRQSITRALADQSRTIRVPVHMSEQIARLNQITRQLEQKLGREPSIDEIAKEMEQTPQKVDQILQLSRRPISLEMPMGEESDSEYGEFVPDDSALEPNELAGKEMLREQLEEVLRSLSPREAEVLELRFGLVDGTAHTLEEVGARFKITRERVRQIETKAIRRLRHPARSSRLRDYLR